MAGEDLVAVWEAHCRYEFETYDVDATMTTMVAEPYVNNVPTMMGGVGHDEVKRFYAHHFVGHNPPDTMVVPVSRTVGADSIVDELIFCFTHTTQMDWMLPGIAPTGRRVEVPLVAIVKFHDGKIANEHIYWDQASVLVQIGKLDPQNLPVAGIDTAHKVTDPMLPRNTLLDDIGTGGAQVPRDKTRDGRALSIANLWRSATFAYCGISIKSLRSWPMPLSPSVPPRRPTHR